jgi:hypothetical protein
MPLQFHCKCGCSFAKRQRLAEHIGLLNPHWPRTSPEDEHAAVTPPDPKSR